MATPLLESKVPPLFDSSHGVVLALEFKGIYAPGISGNNHAELMRRHTAEAVAEYSPAAVMFDLTEPRYTWGDAIGRTALPLTKEATVPIPAGIIAWGRNARALEYSNVVFAALDMMLFSDAEEGSVYLRGFLDNTTA